MEFIAGIVQEKSEQAKARWAAISSEFGESLMRATDCRGEITFEAVCVGGKSNLTGDFVRLGDAAFVCGRMFQWTSYRKLNGNRLDDASFLDRVHHTAGASISREYWGQYAGLFFRPVEGDILLARDPSGGVPIFHAQLDDIGLSIFSNSLAVLCDSLGGSLSLDHKALALSLANTNGIPTRRTCFENISSLLPGECLRLGRDGREISSSIPWWEEVARGGVDRGESLSEAFSGVVGALARESGRIALQLSGGLDSSALLGELVTQGFLSEVHCLSAFRSGGVTDERRFAALAARHVNASLTEIDIEGFQFSLKPASQYKYSPRPHAKLVFSEMEELFDIEAGKAGCNSYWLGYGGDTLFMNYPESSAAIDALQQGGVAAAWRTAVNLGLQAEKSLWKVAREAIAGVARFRSFGDWAKGQSTGWTSKGADLSDADYGAFRLIDRAFAQTPHPAQRRRLYDAYFETWVTAEQGHYYSAGGFGYFRPFYAEPMVAACLGIPTYQTVAYGLNRFPQRQLLFKTMPPEISLRVSKGGADDQVIRALLEDAEEIEATLAGGFLKRIGLLDGLSYRVDKSKITLGEAHKNFHVMNLLACEMWIAGNRDILKLSST